ncbi:MAG: hypothetical protein QOG06_2306 [Gaiellaceae bacterium]|jgi:uncharacterized protein (DUF1501 family)|nr:hypothetical protein [Gaiellaceae bacterium]
MSRNCNHCDEFSRLALFRRGAAEAGRGLPAIEPGMPLPAGTGLDRRSFVSGAAGLALSVYGLGKLKLFDEGIAQAAAGPAQPVLVSVFLPGGADSLSVLYPALDPNYHRLRPTLALPDSAGPVFSEDTRLHWHPSLTPLQTLHAEGKVSVMPAIGYTHPDQSHFTSRHFWEVGATDARLASGWMGRYLDRHGVSDNPLQGLSLDYQLQPSLASLKVPVASLAAPDEYRFDAPGVWGQVENRMLETLAPLGAHRADPGLNQAAKAAAQSDRLRRQLAPFHSDKTGGFGSSVPYPQDDSGFPRQLSGLAAMLAAKLPLRCVAITAPGSYDTHSEQPQALADGLDITARSLFSFQRDLEARGLADRVLTLVWSEFGRRGEENGSGTDHGAAGSAFLIGNRARGRMVGEFPGLTNGLDDDGNLRPTSDFRGVYCSLLEQWLGADASAVIPGAHSFARPALVA